MSNLTGNTSSILCTLCVILALLQLSTSSGSTYRGILLCTCHYVGLSVGICRHYIVENIKYNMLYRNNHAYVYSCAQYVNLNLCIPYMFKSIFSTKICIGCRACKVDIIFRKMLIMERCVYSRYSCLFSEQKNEAIIPEFSEVFTLAKQLSSSRNSTDIGGGLQRYKIYKNDGK